MAIAFARVSIHTRAKGHSAVAASSYRSGTELHDFRTGETHNYSNRQHEIAFSEIILPEGGDVKFLNREFLWNCAESAERRRDAQLCKDVVLALPKELDRACQIELAKRFAHTHFISKGLPADISIHDHEDGNPHAHILIPTRRLEGNQFSKYKARDLNPQFAKGFVVENDYWGEKWREMQNEYFIEKNLDLSVDLNNVLSNRHHGRNHDAKAHYLLEENRLIQEARIEIIKENPEKMIEHISHQNSVFTRRDVERLLFKIFEHSDEPQEFLYHVEKILGHKDVIELGKNTRGQISYTTREQFTQEAKLLENIEAMMTTKKHLSFQSVDRFAKNYNLSEEQYEAFQYITQGSDISIVIGRPGTGKSYLLKPVKEFYQNAGNEVLGVALSGKVAKSLEIETGIRSSTIRSLTYRLEKNIIQLNSKHIIVIDEAGMVDFKSMSILINEAKKAGAKVVMIGDPDQLKPIQGGEIFRGIAARTSFIELENIKRQQDLGDRQASLDLAKGDIIKGVQHYQDKQAITFSDNTLEACDQLLTEWRKELQINKIEDTILLSFTRKTVNYLNEQARETLIAENRLGKENITYQGLERQLSISTGERLLFRENNKPLGVRNGDTGTVTAVTTQQIQVRLDSGESLRIPKDYEALDYAYALTVHKSQGMTAKNVKVLIDSKYWDRNLSYVAMTRHKEQLKIYADKQNHPTSQDLVKTLSRKTIKDNVIDWPIDFGIRAGFCFDSLVDKAVKHIAGIKQKIKHGFNFIVNYESHLTKQKKLNGDNPVKRANAKYAATEMDVKGISSIENEIATKTFENLKRNFPQLTEFETLWQKRQRLVGYSAERADKQIHALSKKLLTNKIFTEQAQHKLPELLIKIQNINKQQERYLYRE